MIPDKSVIIENIKSGIAKLKKIGKSKWRPTFSKVKNITKLRKLQLNLLFDLLEIEDAEFNKLWNRNLDLLKGEDLKFSVSKIESRAFNGHPSRITGKINKHGTLIAEPTGTMRNFLGKKSFPKEYIGRINGIGQIYLKSVSHGYTLLGNVRPKSFKGSITSNGDIQMEINEKANELWFQNNIGRLACDPFGKNNEGRNEFLQNKDQIMRKAALRLAFIEKELR